MSQRQQSPTVIMTLLNKGGLGSGPWSKPKGHQAGLHPHCWGVGFPVAYLFWRGLLRIVQNDPDGELTAEYYV